jgi:RNA polymerase sigma factor (sigma-70 family)
MDTILKIEMTATPKKSVASAMNNYGKRLSGFIRGKVNSAEDAEDILQEVWYQLSNLPSIDEIESISGWLYSVARNKITDLFRKKKHKSLNDFSFENEDGALSFKEILLLDETSNPDLAFFKELFWKELLAALDELPENQRQVFVQNELEDMTLQEIADQNHENLKTVISRKGYAVKHLRKKLNYLYNEINS